MTLLFGDNPAAALRHRAERQARCRKQNRSTRK